MPGTGSVLVSGVRTAIGSFQGKLSALRSPDLGAIVLREVLRRVGLDPVHVDEVLMGCVLQGGLGQAPARQAAKAAGFPNSVGAVTINKVCGSGLKSVALADQMIRCGDASIVVAGGMESMSNAPYYFPKARTGLRLGHGELLDGMVHDGLWDPYNDFHMGSAGDRCASLKKVSRETQDAFARRSYERALQAISLGLFRREIVPVEVRQNKEILSFDVDEEPGRGAQRLDKMAQLKGAFGSDGTVTAANSSKLSDGAAAVLVMSDRRARDLGAKARFRILGSTHAALAPEDFPIAPIHAIRRLSDRIGLKIADVDRFEINEAFSVVAEVCMQDLELDSAKVNVRGGAVSLGHPIGASGARLLVSLMHILEDENLSTGIATLCLGGGEAIALAVERIS